ncbi:MAG: 1,4-alpha-glucan branching protein GlgB [Myxococcales bacterium]|nr:1,4-alpha-glucan branching protein GlgB [Myxococcales bacterium]
MLPDATALSSTEVQALRERFHAAMGFDAWRWLGAHPHPDGGFHFAVWAPRAQEIQVKGDFSAWQGEALTRDGDCFVGHIEQAQAGQLYKLAVRDLSGQWAERSDPFAFASELRPGTASRLVGHARHIFGDGHWLAARKGDDHQQPMSIYEVHLGSWLRHGDGRSWGYREVADRLVAHVMRLGFTHVEFLPLAEYPYDPSWGYQVTGFFAPTSRYGNPDDLRYLIDRLHQAGIGVIMDWVPAHFPKDAHALAQFDGAPLFEYADPRLGEHPDWGTLVFDYARPEVRSFLLASACHWIESFHIDGLRVDAVASMLYLDYSREAGQWLPNRFGGRENLDAISFLQDLNRVVRQTYPGVVTIAEESTAFAAVTGDPVPPLAPQDAGLGFSLKWNMGWMHDSLSYFSRAPEHRRWHHHELTFSSSYADAEAFVLPLSHDEVVHGKGSLVRKMGGDWRTGLAQLRVLYGLQWLSPGKKLVFMGCEFGQEREWDFDGEIPWGQAAEKPRKSLEDWLAALNRLYRSHPALVGGDHDTRRFSWVDADDAAHSIYAFSRHSMAEPDAEADSLLVIVNAADVPREGYVLPTSGSWRVLLHSSDFDGSTAKARPPMPSGPHGDNVGILLDVPAYSVLVLGRA